MNLAPSTQHQDLKDRILPIKLVILDIDGVLTDGRIIFGDYGDELKFFDVQDGLGLVMLYRAGIRTVIISAKKSKVNNRRAREVRAAKIYQGVKDKLIIYEKVLKEFKLGHAEVCFVGDDLIDIPILTRAGFAVAVQNAVEEAKGAAHYVTQKKGGRGAVRELTDLILKTQGRWEELTKGYYP